jgi:hypothetical protein
VEDDSDDVFAMKMACQRSGISHHLLVAENGDAAVEYLSGEGKYKEREVKESKQQNPPARTPALHLVTGPAFRQSNLWRRFAKIGKAK